MLRGAIYSTLVTAFLSTLCHHCGWFLQLSTLSNIYTPVTRVKFKATNNCVFIRDDGRKWVLFTVTNWRSSLTQYTWQINSQLMNRAGCKLLCTYKANWGNRWRYCTTTQGCWFEQSSQISSSNFKSECVCGNMCLCVCSYMCLYVTTRDPTQQNSTQWQDENMPS